MHIPSIIRAAHGVEGREELLVLSEVAFVKSVYYYNTDKRTHNWNMYITLKSGVQVEMAVQEEGYKKIMKSLINHTEGTVNERTKKAKTQAAETR